MEKKLNTISKEEKIKFELMKAAEDELKEKFDIISFFKRAEQLSIMKKIFLNECQAFMLRNIDLPLISNETSSFNPSMEELKQLKVEKINRKKEKLKEYLKKNKDENTLSKIDQLLFSYMDSELKDTLIKKE